jgi:hypothetical protein
LPNQSAKHLFSYLRAICLLALISQLFCGAVLSYHTSKDILIKLPSFPKPTDPNSTELSPIALQVAGFLGIENSLRRLETLRKQLASTTGSKPALETRQEYTELKLDMLTAIEQARLDIDFVSAELEDEHARDMELYQSCNDEQTRRILRANINAFRTNGILWAVAESLDIPTYKSPKYSIPSGTIGIIAGIVPSIFSLYAVRPPKERYIYTSYPNMLCKIFAYPVTPRTEYPNSVWSFLNAKPVGEPTRTRREIMIEHWSSDKNIHCSKKLKDKDTLDLVTGTKQEVVTPDLLSDQILMLNETKAIVLQMNRPLMELMMLVRGQKQF